MKKILTALCLAAAALICAAPDASADSQSLRELAENMNANTSDGFSAYYNGTYFEIRHIISNSEDQDVWIDNDEKMLRTMIGRDDNFRAVMDMLYHEGAAFMLVLDCGERGERSFYFTLPEEKAILGY